MKFNSLESTRRQRPKENTSGLTEAEKERGREIEREREGDQERGREVDRERGRSQLARGEK